MERRERKNLNKTLFVWLIIAIFSLGFIISKNTQANSNRIELIYPNKHNSLFMESSQKPGDTVTKNIIIRNNYADERILGIQAANFSGNVNLAQVLEIKLQSGALDFTSTLANLENVEAVVGQVSSGDSSFNVTLNFRIDSSNAYQGNSLTFDLVFGFIEQEPGGGITTTTPIIPDLPGLIRRLPTRLITTLTPDEEITPPVETPTPEGKIKGKETETASSMKFRIAWWQWLLAILMALLIFFLLFWRRRREEEDSEEEIKI